MKTQTPFVILAEVLADGMILPQPKKTGLPLFYQILEGETFVGFSTDEFVEWVESRIPNARVQFIYCE